MSQVKVQPTKLKPSGSSENRMTSVHHLESNKLEIDRKVYRQIPLAFNSLREPTAQEIARASKNSSCGKS